MQSEIVSTPGIGRRKVGHDSEIDCTPCKMKDRNSLNRETSTSWLGGVKRKLERETDRKTDRETPSAGRRKDEQERETNSTPWTSRITEKAEPEPNNTPIEIGEE